jgi:hypothetical protein
MCYCRIAGGRLPFIGPCTATTLTCRVFETFGPVANHPLYHPPCIPSH